MPVVAGYVLAFAAFAVLGFPFRRWVGLVLPPIVWSLLFLFGPEQGWWGSESEIAWALVISFGIFSMLTMTVGILLGQMHRGRASRSQQAPRRSA